jgi:hypothetical protein
MPEKHLPSHTMQHEASTLYHHMLDIYLHERFMPVSHTGSCIVVSEACLYCAYVRDFDSQDID